MSEDKYFQRQHNRFIKGGPRKEIYQSAEVKNSSSESELKEETVTPSFAIIQPEPISQEKTPFSLATTAQDNLKKLIACSKVDFETLIRDKILRQDLKKQQRRLTKARNDAKLNVSTDTELSITAINGIIGLAEQYINDVNRQKAQKVAPKSTLRANQQKQIARQLKTIDQQIELNNFATVKSTIQILLKKFGKDELLQEKLGYLNYMLALNEEYERQAGLLKDLNAYIEKLSSVDTAAENISQSSLALKNLKKQTTIALNKQNKKQQPNQRTLALLSQVDKIGGLLSGLVEAKTQRKGVEVKSKRQLQLEKQLQEKIKSTQFLDESSKYCRDLLQKAAESKEELYKEFETLKKNRKKANEVPYSMILRIYDSIVSQKREINEANLYLKACSQLYLRKNLNAQNLGIEIKKIDQKYATNETLIAIKPNIDILVNNAQERERNSKQASSLELELKKLRTQNQKLQRLIQEKNKLVEAPVEGQKVEKVDKRKQLEQKRARDAQRVKQQKQEKEIERSLDNIYNNLQQKKWKIAKNAINVYTKRYEESTSITAIKPIQSLTTILNIMQDVQNAENRASQTEKREKTNVGNLEKQKQMLNQKLRSSEEYENTIKNLIQNFNQESFSTKKYFDDLRKDRKKIVQQRYQIINRLQEPITVFRQGRQGETSEKLSLSFSSSSIETPEFEKIKRQRQEVSAALQKEKQKIAQLQSKLKQSTKNPQINKDAQQLLNLSKRIEKGGEWWKFVPKNLKNSTFKHIYSILQKYRQNQLILQSHQMSMINEQVFKEEEDILNNAFEISFIIIQSTDDYFNSQLWEKKLSNFKGNKNCDKLISCLKLISDRARVKLEEQRLSNDKNILFYKQQIQQLSNAINDLQKPKDTHTEKSSSKLQESSAKKSPELKSSRRSSKSKDKDREGQVKEAIQEYVQQERKMLSKIDELEGDKQNLEMKAVAIENQLVQAQRKLQDQRIGFENARFAAQKIRLQQHQRITQLQGQLQISEGRRLELQGRLQAQIGSFGELERQLTSKLHYFQQKQAHHQESLNSQSSSNEVESRLTSQLNYYREMYGQLSKQLQLSKEKEQMILRDFESLRINAQILEKKYHADVDSHHKTPEQQATHSQQSHQANSPLKMKPYKIDLNSQKIFDLYLDAERVPSSRKKKEIVEEKPLEVAQVPSNPHIAQIAHLKQQIERLQSQLRAMEVLKSQQIEREVITALQNQQSDFNEFLKRFEAEKFQFFINEILPTKVEEELALRSLPNTPNYEFMHNEWIINEFPRLYDERHKRQCPNANMDVDVIVNSRLEAARDSIYQETRAEWEIETNGKIQKSLYQFQQNTIPVIVAQIQKEWQLTKEKQWELKSWQRDQYWRRLLEEEKLKIRTKIIQSSPELKKPEELPQRQILVREPNELQLLQIMRRQSSRHIIEALFAEQLTVWQQTKTSEWLIQRNQIESHWQNVIIPERLKQWEAEKEKETTKLRLVWLQQNNRQWNIRLNQVIIPQTLKEYQQKTAKQVQQIKATTIVLVQSQLEIIQRWKNANLPAIIEAQIKFAIEQFIKIDLPLILNDEKIEWLKLQPVPDVNQILNDQHLKWQQEKAREISFLSSTFDIKLNQILQLEHAEWERLKVIEFQQLLVQQQARLNASSPSPLNIEQILVNEHQHWELMKLQQIRRIELDFETRLNEIERKLNSQIIDYQEKFLKEQSRISEAETAAVARWRNNQLPQIIVKQREACILQFKSKQLPKIIQQKYHDWESVDLIQLIHTEKNRYIVDNIISQRNRELEKEKQQITVTFEGRIGQIRQFYEKQLKNQRELHEVEKRSIVSNRVESFKHEDLAELENKKNIQIQLKMKEADQYWETVILPQRQEQWRREQIVAFDELLKNKIAQVEATYQQDYIPNIINEEWKKWEAQFRQKLIKKQEEWLASLPTLLKSARYSHYMQPILESQASQYELQIKKLQAESSSYAIKIQQLTNQTAEYESRLRENKAKYELAESKINSLLSNQDMTVRRTIEESQRLNEELTRSKWAEKEVDQLRKIIDMQKAEVVKLTATVREGERLKLEYINLQEVNSNLQKVKWQEANQIRSSYESKILEMSTQRNNLQLKVSQLQIGKKQGTDKEAILSLERQIAILTSTLKTKDAEITFLKKTIETVNAELRENRQKFNEELQKRGSSERLLAQMRSARLELDYEIKYLKDRQESLTKKLQLKDQQLNTLRKKIQLDSDSIEKKLRSSLQYATSYQAKFSEIQSLLTIKTKEAQTFMVDLDRARYENQGLTANVQNLSADVQKMRRQVRQLQAEKSRTLLEKERNSEEINRLKQTIIHHEQQLKRQTDTITRLSTTITNEKNRFESEIKMYKQEIIHLQVEVKDAERIKRLEIERASKLQRELAEGSREAELGEIEVLKKINNDVSDLTATNRQLEMKCLLLENRQKITSASSETINSFLLIQKHTDHLLDFLLKESIVPNLQLYHKFLAESRTALAAGRAQEYFELWEKLLCELFQLTIACRSQEIRTQAEELLRLRDEMTDVLQRQIEASEGEQNQLVQDYKQVLNDIKSLVREYMRSGDDQYLRLLCSSLGITL